MTTQPAKKPRTPKRDCILVNFTGIIRLPINAGDVSTITAANGEASAVVEAMKKAIGHRGELVVSDAKFGKMMG